MLPDTSIQRLEALLTDSAINLAYYVHPLPRGVISAAQGGLAVLFGAGLASHHRYDEGQRLRFRLMGLVPPGHGEVITLNDARLSVATAVIERGQLVFSRNEAERVRYELLILNQGLDFAATVRRVWGDEADGPGRQAR
jgi:hypothetical protein